jgi:hypothetical protein
MEFLVLRERKRELKTLGILGEEKLTNFIHIT